MNLNQIERNINTELVLFYGILSYGFYPNQIWIRMDIRNNLKNSKMLKNKFTPNPKIILNKYPNNLRYY